MNMKQILVTFTALLLTAIVADAQVSSYEDFTYPHQAVKERKPIPYRYIREANVKWSKRVHRVIDTREKQNKVMHWPRNPFYLVIWNSVMEGVEGFAPLTAYSSDSLTSITTPEDIRKMTTIVTTTWVPNPDNPNDPYDLVEQEVPIEFAPEDIEKYRIMEDWIFDYNYSDFRARIIAIAPLYRPLTESGIELGEQPLVLG